MTSLQYLYSCRLRNLQEEMACGCRAVTFQAYDIKHAKLVGCCLLMLPKPHWAKPSLRVHLSYSIGTNERLGTLDMGAGGGGGSGGGLGL